MSEIEDKKSADEDIAAKRYFIMGLVRIASVALVMAGIAMSRAVIPGPYAVGVALAAAGLIAFFFGPTLLVKRWKAGDRDEQ